MGAFDLIDIFVAALYAVLFAYSVPLYLRANGTRPSIAFSLYVTFLMGAGAIKGLTDHGEDWFYPTLRIATGLGLYAHVRWAASKHNGTHPLSKD